ncbi:unnamed protein product [Triticum turgidum subsp. durum]|uniref:Pectinesterase inhibitor domain-containing protein n=1 Tax=Triticum turgidum subsp. durum TaxID=4567 RepID=A0A9R0VBD3_TRITD|nr:unnamed protein product [Triticum turgidum subsp. durum]
MAVGTSSSMLGGALLLLLVLSSAIDVHGGSSSSAAPRSPLDELCIGLGGCIESALAHAKNVKARKVMRSCLQLYVGAVPRLQWAARSVAAGRYSGVPDVLEAAYRDVSQGCSSLAGEVALPKENNEFFMMAFVVHAVVDRVQRIIG